MKCRHCLAKLNEANWYPAHRKVRRKICKACHTARGPKDDAVRQRRFMNRLKKNDPEEHKRRLRRYRIKVLYGMTEEDLHALYAKQDGRCAICKNPEGEKSLCVDHDHQTSEVRGLLCNACNAMLGYAKDNTETLRRAIYYLIDPPK